MNSKKVPQLTHIDAKGKARMVDVGSKPLQFRIARAEGAILLGAETLKLIRENAIRKGDVLTVAQLAGIQAAKQTPFLIPLCHNLLLTKIEVQLAIVENGVHCTAEVHCNGQTGVEMEALTAVSVALLTVYDMCKAVDKSMVIGPVQLIEKTKSDMAV
jgi:cyclic pyranopterin phosphate synthase